MSAYLLSLIIVGIAGRMARKENTLSDFYLAGRGMGVFLLFLTLYATQYSGNTLIGFAGKAYREGYMALVSVTFMMSVIGAYLIFAPKLFTLSRLKKYITVGDYIYDRFGSSALRLIVVIICIVALGNYILTNLKAMGYIISFSTGGSVTMAQGIIGLSVIMVVYETLGGMRSVAWTDTIQGVLLLLGCVTIFVAFEYQYNGLSLTAEYFIANNHELWTPPSAEQKRLWLSTLIVVFFSVSIYPHAIQRIYSAKDEKTLKRSFQIMVFMPIFTTLLIIMIGIVGAFKFPGLDKDGSERITLIMLSDLAQQIKGMEYIIVLFISAAVAAIMSTVDSALLAISSLFTQDLYRPMKKSASQSHLTFVGKIFSWGIMGFMAYLALVLPQTIWRLFEIKLEILCQIAPAIFLGVHIKSLKAGPVFWGIVSGVSITLFIMFARDFGLDISPKPFGFHGGIWGLAVNFLLVGLLSLIDRKTATV